MSRYCKKPIEVDAFQYTGDQKALFEWGDQFNPPPLFCRRTQCGMPLAIHTLEGDMMISDGDYAIRGVAGEFYPCKPGIFEASYDCIPEAE